MDSSARVAIPDARVAPMGYVVVMENLAARSLVYLFAREPRGVLSTYPFQMWVAQLFWRQGVVIEEILEKPLVDVYGPDQHSWQNVMWTVTFGTLKAILATVHVRWRTKVNGPYFHNARHAEYVKGLVPVWFLFCEVELVIRALC